MHKTEKSRLEISSRCTANFSLRCVINDFIKKIHLLIKSLLYYAVLKIKFGKDIKIKPINAIRGKLEIQLQKNSKLKMGVFLMTTGPCYIKIIENAKCSIGDKVFMNHNCSITCANEITIGDNCNLANNIVIVDHDHNIGDTGVVAGLNSKPIHIGNNVWIGANVTILKGVTIGDGVIVAAGAVVRQDIPNCEIWGGVPARKICKLGERYVN